jgi:hypothetical protein
MKHIVQKYMSLPCRDGKEFPGGLPDERFVNDKLRHIKKEYEADEKRRFAPLAEPDDAHVSPVTHVERAANAPKGGRGLGSSRAERPYYGEDHED